MRPSVDVVVVGGGQAGLATSFYLKRAGIDHVVLDAEQGPGGAWRHTWDSLRLFSPAVHSSLPGWQMPSTSDPEGYPDADHVLDYLTRYEKRYELPVHRPVTVEQVTRTRSGFRVVTDQGQVESRAVVLATGTWTRPFVPAYPGASNFAGRQLHSSVYRGPQDLHGQRVVVVGGANSGAQIAAELVEAVDLTWCTLDDPRYLPDDVDGRELFRVASARVRGEGEGVGGLGDIVAVPPVRRARDELGLRAERMFARFTPDGVEWDDGRAQEVDVVIWCTGFRPALQPLSSLDVPRADGVIQTDGPVVRGVPGLYLVGYGDWTGAASATLIGVGQWAKAAVTDLQEQLAR
ncbi:ArsO family NAD(P)H-dependent flavin-containing monooxygenase [Ornithinimicrobium sp. Y1847]|uniref:ArsO family NAD(P)H-dependent flavin-containing monooxygenase n=1 Tax=unclassified Ornithinimicrobium TaxID=2615080 RepID=UPI003B6852AB